MKIKCHDVLIKMNTLPIWVRFWHEINEVPIESSSITLQIINAVDINELIKQYKYPGNSHISKSCVSQQLWDTLSKFWSADVNKYKYCFNYQNGVPIFLDAQYKILSSRPEPPPVNSGISVTERLIDWLEQHGYRSSRDLILERQAYGIQKYGQTLMSNDGRNSVEDARQEIGDLMQYLMKISINGESCHQLKEPIQALIKLCDEMKLIN